MKKLLPLVLCVLLLAGCAETYDGPTTTKSVLSSTESDYYNEDDSTCYTTRTEYAYDIYGNQSQILEYSYAADDSEAEPYRKTVLHYDEAGHTVRQVQYDLSGWFPKKISDARYTYDDQGRMTSTRYRYGLEWDTSTITYDDENRTRTTAANGSEIVEYLDENGAVIRTESTSAGGEHILEEYDRRSDGQTLTTRIYRNGILTTVTEQTYDDQGRLLTWSVSGDSATAVFQRYEYGEDYEKCIYADGSYSVTDFNPDGTIDDRMEVSADGTVTSLTIYRYTEIRVPAEQEETP